MRSQEPLKSLVKVSKSDTMSENMSCFRLVYDNIEAVLYRNSIGIRID
jgi:hypothetical protein